MQQSAPYGTLKPAAGHQARASIPSFATDYARDRVLRYLCLLGSTVSLVQEGTAFVRFIAKLNAGRGWDGGKKG